MTDFEQQEQEIQRLNLRIAELEKKVEELGGIFLQLGLKLAAKASALETAAEIDTEPTAQAAGISEDKENKAADEGKPAIEAAEPSEAEETKAVEDIVAEVPVVVDVKQVVAFDAEQSEINEQDKPVGAENLQINKFLQTGAAFLQKYAEHGSNADYDMHLDIKKECVKKLLNYPQWEAIPAELLKELVFIMTEDNYPYCADVQSIGEGFYCFVAPCEPADEKFTSRELIRSALPLMFNIDYTPGFKDKAFELVRPAVMKCCDDETYELYEKGELRLVR